MGRASGYSGAFSATLVVFILALQHAYGAKLSVVQIASNSAPGMSGLAGAYDVKLSPDGRFLYAPSDMDNATVVFARNSNTGLLTFLQKYIHVYHAFNCYISPDGLFLYTAGAV